MLKNLLNKALLLVLLIATLPILSKAESIKISDLSHLNQLELSSLTTKHFRIHTFVRGFGRINFEFDELKKSSVLPEIITAYSKYYDENPVYLLKGWAKTRHGLERATASISKSTSGFTLNISFSSRSRIKKSPAIVRLLISRHSNKTSGIIERTLNAHLKHASCAADNLSLNSTYFTDNTRLKPDIALSSDSTYKIELSIHVDNAYIQNFGNNSQFVLSRFNEVETIYEDQLGLTFTIKRLSFDNTLTFSSAQADSLLESFGSYIDSKNLFSSADIFHLYTGRDLIVGSSSGVIGIAYQGLSSPPDPGVVCRYSNSLSLGASERIDSTTSGLLAITTAHEMGHNFGAEHTADGIMAAVALDPLPEEFSSESVDTITGHVTTYGSNCLEEITATPTATATPTPTGTSTATPTPTSTPNGGGGSGMSLDGVNPAVVVNLATSLDRNGNFSAEITLEEEPEEDCQIVLLAGPKSSTISWKNKVIYSAPATLSTSVSTLVNKAMQAKTKKGKISKVFLTAFLSCSDNSKSGVSSIKRIRPDNIRANGNKLFYTGWVNYLKAELE